MATHPLKKFRESFDPAMSQEELAAKLGVSKATVSRWEDGKRFPDREYWGALKELTGIGPEDMQAAAERPASDVAA